MRKASSPVRELEEGNVPYVNWQLLQQPPEQGPKLLWTSMTSVGSRSERAELDSAHLPELTVIGERYRYNKDNLKKPNPDIVLGCKVFWEAFGRSRLVIIFDRYGDDMLLRRIHEGLKTKGALTMQTLVVFSGTVTTSPKLLGEIRDTLADLKSRLDFHFLPRMRSETPPFPHDRFAVTNGEFWHFGGSVAGHEGLTGVSRGWKAKDLGVEKFVKDTWALMAREAAK